MEHLVYSCKKKERVVVLFLGLDYNNRKHALQLYLAPARTYNPHNILFMYKSAAAVKIMAPAADGLGWGFCLIPCAVRKKTSFCSIAL